jgi:hypothetical protein
VINKNVKCVYHGLTRIVISVLKLTRAALPRDFTFYLGNPVPRFLLS